MHWLISVQHCALSRASAPPSAPGPPPANPLAAGAPASFGSQLPVVAEGGAAGVDDMEEDEPPALLEDDDSDAPLSGSDIGDLDGGGALEGGAFEEDEDDSDGYDGARARGAAHMACPCSGCALHAAGDIFLVSFQRCCRSECEL